jgi:hypothetical protein
MNPHSISMRLQRLIHRSLLLQEQFDDTRSSLISYSAGNRAILFGSGYAGTKRLTVQRSTT